MTQGRRGTDRATGHVLTISMRDETGGDGFLVDAGCGCGYPNRVGGHGWTWMGWGADPSRAASGAAVEWQEHVADVARRFGHLTAQYRGAGA